MNALFETVEDFVDELSRIENPSTVRVSACSKVINNGVSEVSLVSSFYKDDCFYQLNIDCGEDRKGGDPEGTNTATEARQRIMSSCEDIGVSCRGGEWRK